MRVRIIVLSLLAVLFAVPSPVHASSFLITNLASDQPGVAPFTDPQLRNPWGIAQSSTSPFWIGSNAAGVAEIYNGAGVKQALVVTMPGLGNVTGVAFTGGSAGQFNNDLFLFSLEDGTVAGWRGALGTTAEVLQLPLISNVYKGMAVGTIGANTYAYIANFRNGTIDVLKGAPGTPDLAGNFTDPSLPSGYAPFNIENINGTIYVTYALQDSAKFDDVAGAGNGIVTRFDLNGNFLGRVVTRGALNSPWGLALAPSGFGSAAGALLIGNNGDGRINAYDPLTGTPFGPLLDASNNPLVITGLWGLEFGNGTSSQANGLYFTAGPANAAYGLFGEITAAGPTAAPEPSGLVLLSTALAGIVVLHRRRSSGKRAE